MQKPSNSLNRCMIIRSVKDQNDEARYAKSMQSYNERRERRMKNAGVENKSDFRLKYDQVIIREYPMILGVNPAVSKVSFLLFVPYCGRIRRLLSCVFIL